MGRIKKIKAFSYINWYIITNFHDIVPLSLFNLTYFSGYGRNLSNNFAPFLENLRHDNFVLRLPDLSCLIKFYREH